MTHATIHPVAAHVMSLVKPWNHCKLVIRKSRQRHGRLTKHVDAGTVSDTADYSLRTQACYVSCGTNARLGLDGAGLLNLPQNSQGAGV